MAIFILTSHLHYFDRNCFSSTFHRIILQFKWGEIRRSLVQFSVQSIYMMRPGCSVLYLVSVENLQGRWIRDISGQASPLLITVYPHSEKVSTDKQWSRLFLERLCNFHPWRFPVYACCLWSSCQAPLWKAQMKLVDNLLTGPGNLLLEIY